MCASASSELLQCVFCRASYPLLFLSVVQVCKVVPITTGWQAEHELKKERKRDADDFLSQARKDIANLVRRLKEGELTRDKTREAAHSLEKLQKERKRDAEQED